MEKLNIGFIYNVRHRYRDPENPLFQLEADFDDPKTIKSIVVHLKECFTKVYPIEANEEAYPELKKLKKKLDIVLNYSEGIYGKDREAQLPAILEMLRIPYTGSGPLTQCLSLNKAKAKEVLMANKIPTLPFQTFRRGNEVLKGTLGYPLIVKPIAQGSSAGITNNSIVENEDDLRKRIKKIINRFKQAVLVEPFIKGREFSVPMLGNPPRILPIIEPDYSKLPSKYLPLDSLEVKWIYEESGEHHLICPAKIEDGLHDRVNQICLKTWDALDVKDWCRVDIRCDLRGKPYVLEINSPAGVIPPEISKTSYFPLAARASGIDYNNMIKEIIKSALERYKDSKLLGTKSPVF